MKCIGIALLILNLIASSAFGAVWIRHPSVSQNDFEVHVKTTPGDRGFIENYLENPVEPLLVAELGRLFEEAQKNFLRDDLRLAKRGYAKVIALQWEADWAAAQRRVIFSSHLRAAQLEEDPGERARVLQTAATFAGPMAPDAELFPPPLLRDFENEKAGLEKTVKPWSPDIARAEALLINGRPYEANGFSPIPLFEGRVRLTVLSNTMAPLSSVVDTAALMAMQFSLKPFSDEPCAKDVRWAREKLLLFSGRICEPETAAETPMMAMGLPASPEKPTAKSGFLQSKAFWILAGAVISAFAYSEMDRQRQTQKPRATVEKPATTATGSEEETIF